jgi:hypothetical protein
MSSATSGSRWAAVIEQPLPWQTHQGVPDGAGDLLDHFGEAHRGERGAAKKTWLQRPEQPVLDQRRYDQRRKLAACFDLVCRLRKSGGQAPVRE